MADRRPLCGMLGLGGDDVAPCGWTSPVSSSTYVIAGPPGSGRSTALGALAASLLRGGTGVVALTPRESPLRGLEGRAGAAVVSSLTPTEQELTAALETVGGRPRWSWWTTPTCCPCPGGHHAARYRVSGRDRGLGLACAGPAEALVSPLSALDRPGAAVPQGPAVVPADHR